MNSLTSVGSSVQSAFGSGLATVSAANQRVNQDAQQISNPAQNSPAPLLDLSQASLQSQAGAAVLRTANQTLGTLLNAFA